MKSNKKLKSILKHIDYSFSTHITYESWGVSILITHKNASAKMYWYNDDDTTIYLSSLKVEAKCQGLGTKLQEIRENIGIELGATIACLWVRKDEWMYNWYQHRSYTYLVEHIDDGYVWMQKELK